MQVQDGSTQLECDVSVFDEFLFKTHNGALLAQWSRVRAAALESQNTSHNKAMVQCASCHGECDGTISVCLKCWHEARISALRQ